MHELLRILVNYTDEYLRVALVQYVYLIVDYLQLAWMLTILECDYGLGLAIAAEHEKTIIAIVAHIYGVVVFDVSRYTPLYTIIYINIEA